MLSKEYMSDLDDKLHRCEMCNNAILQDHVGVGVWAGEVYANQKLLIMKGNQKNAPDVRLSKVARII